MGLSDKIFNDIKEVAEEIIMILRRYYEDPGLIKKLTFFPYISEISCLK
ncbi:hypothetical protein [Candidatus Kryptobacter tengchongensis]|nr:hypothetical protein [Candidatus Kryptobacter tengchongensis]CUS84804.1 hypothetical protein JGI20_00942 [Candidatus Kryptobacter tengchongensis]